MVFLNFFNAAKFRFFEHKIWTLMHERVQGMDSGKRRKRTLV